MAQATYDLAAAGTFTHAVTGIPARFGIGTYPHETALAYGMPGATAPATPDPFTPAQIAYIADVVADAVTAATEALPPGPVILVPNGSFIANTTGWVAVNGDETIAWEDETSLFDDGSGCLSANREAGTCSINYAPDGGPIPLGTATILFASFWAMTAHADISTQIVLTFYADATYDNYIADEGVPLAGGSLAAVSSTWGQVARGGILVPAGATHLDVKLRGIGLDDTDPILYDNIAVWGV